MFTYFYSDMHLLLDVSQCCYAIILFIACPVLLISHSVSLCITFPVFMFQVPVRSSAGPPWWAAAICSVRLPSKGGAIPSRLPSVLVCDLSWPFMPIYTLLAVFPIIPGRPALCACMRSSHWCTQRHNFAFFRRK